MKKRVLLAVNHDAYARQFARWAQVLKRKTDWEPVVWLAANYMDRHMTAGRAEGITVLSPPQDMSRTSAPPRWARPAAPQETSGTPATIAPLPDRPSLRQRVRAVIGRIPSIRPAARLAQELFSVARVPVRISAFRREMHTLRNIIREYQIGVVIFPESSPGYRGPLIIQAAHDAGIPAIVAPIEQTRSHHTAENWLQAPYLSLNRPLNRLIAAFYPRWVLAHKELQLLRVDATELLALEWLRLGPPHPWQIVGNREDLIVLDSATTLDVYLTEGVAPERMIVTGGPEHDLMSELLPDVTEHREALYRRLGLPPGRPMLLSPLVQEHFVTGRPECEFRDYAAMLDFWVQSLAAVEKYNVVVNLHPSHSYNQDPRSWNFIEQSGLRICNDDLTALVPLCDLYVAAGSSTIPWAVACGKPVINYDVYRYGTMVYSSAQGVVSMQNQAEFLDVLKRLTTDTAYYQAVATRQRDSAERWGVLDGGSANRLANACDAIVAARKKTEVARS